MKILAIIPAALGLALTACGGAEQDAAPAEKPLSELNVNSAKRQCVSVAVLQQVPQDAAKDVCDCTVDRLIEKGQFKEETMPTDAQQQVALDSCIAEYEPNPAADPQP